MAIKRRHTALTPEQKHAWRIDNAKRHIAHFEARKDEHRLRIWRGVLELLESRSAEEVREREREADEVMQKVNNVFTRKARMS